MSIYHYIGANKKLPLGERGRKKIDSSHGEDNQKTVIRIENYTLPEGSIPLEQIIKMPNINSNEIEEYETMEDAAGIYIGDIYPSHSKIKKHFKSKYIYQFSANFAYFSLNERLLELDSEMYLVNKKCFNELFKYIEENINENEEIEIYSCWDNEEEEPRIKRLDMIINLNSFEIGVNFELEDKQYIIVNRTK